MKVLHGAEKAKLLFREAETHDMGVIDAEGNWVIPLVDRNISSIAVDGIRLSEAGPEQNNKFIDQEGIPYGNPPTQGSLLSDVIGTFLPCALRTKKAPI